MKGILFIAPLPPPTTGQSVACELLYKALKKSYGVILVDLRRNTFRSGLNSFVRVWEVLGLLWKIFLHSNKVDVIYFNVSQSVSGTLKDLTIYALCFRRLDRMIIHLHGGAGMREILSSKHPFLFALNRFFLKRVGAIVVLGSRLNNIYSDFIPKERLHAVANFASDEFFVTKAEVKQKFDDIGTLRLLFLSNLLPGKGHFELLAALRQLSPSDAARFHVDFAGGFESAEDEAEFRKLAGEVKNCSITVHGVVLGDLKSNLLRNAHVFCLPTYYKYEGQPISILEAFASGCCVLTTDHSGIFDTFTPHINGLEVVPRSVESIVDALMYSLMHTEKIREYAIANQDHAVERFRASNHVAALEGLITSVHDHAGSVHEGRDPNKLGGSSVVTTCSRCIMDISDPNIRFDHRGWCDYCVNFDQVISPTWKTDSAARNELMALAEKIKFDGRGKDFDCIIGLSGGLDSSYSAYVAKELMGLRPLLFHVDAGWNTDQAVGNIEKLVDGLGLELYTEVINWEEMKDLQTAFLRSGIADQDLPQDAAFFSALYKFARLHRVKHVITGSNFSTECCREPEEWGGYLGIDTLLFKDIHRQFGRRPLDTFPLTDILISKVYYQKILGMEVHHPLNFIPFIKKDAEDELEQRFGWMRFKHKHHESRFTRFYEDYWLPRRFGFQKRRAHFSSLIQTGQMTREAALERIATPEMDEHFLKQEFEYVAHKLDLEVSELQQIFDSPKKTYRDYRNKRWMIGIGANALRWLGLEKRYFR